MKIGKKLGLDLKRSARCGANPEPTATEWQQDGNPEWLRVDQFNGKTWYLVVAAAAAEGIPSYFGGFPTREEAEEMWRIVREKVADCEMDLRQECRSLAYSRGR
jgi:hypothetical protein